MRPSRRRLLALIRSLLGLGFAAKWSVFAPRRAAATAETPPPERYREALRTELGGAEPLESREITLVVPTVAEDGALVPVEIESRIAATDRLVLFVEHNPFPLIAAFQFTPGAAPYASLRIKMSESSNVVVLARANGSYFRTAQRVRVVRGGCG